MGIELPEISLYITKSSYTDGTMRWSAVNSDTSADLYGERMSLELYRGMIKKINSKEPPPAAFKSMVCSEYWCGGMPYISIAHYPDANGTAVPGQPTDLFVDGEQLKAKGVLFENDLGKQVWKSLKLDENNPTNDERIRISIAFLDLAHKHGEDGNIFKRNSLTDVCPECVKKVGNKIYLDGYLVHLALTRKPVNPRTIMQPEDIMAKKSQIQTRKEDAASIVGEELANEIEKSALETKSEVLIEMSDTPEVPLVSPVVEEAKTKKDNETMTAGDTNEADCEDEEEDTVPAKKSKSLTAEDVTEIVKSALVEFAKTKKDVSGDEGGKSEPDPEEDKKAVAKKSVLDIATDELYNSVNSAIQLQGVSIEQRLESINPALGNLGSAITALVRESLGEVAPNPVSNDQALVLEAVSSLTNTVKELAQELALLKEKSLVAQVPARVPAPRSIQAQQLVTQSQTQPVNPNSVANIVRRSVSSNLPLK